MTPFQQAIVPASELLVVIRDLCSKWVHGDPQVRSAFPNAKTAAEALAQITAHIEEDHRSNTVWLNDLYQVAVYRRANGKLVHLSIKRRDRQPIHDWRHLQQIKNMLVGPENEAVELYPAESRCVDAANQYHLWVAADPAYRFPFGFETRLVSEDAVGKSVQRPFEKTA